MALARSRYVPCGFFHLPGPTQTCMPLTYQYTMPWNIMAPMMFPSVTGTRLLSHASPHV